RVPSGSRAHLRQLEASCAGPRPDGVYAYAERSQDAQIAQDGTGARFPLLVAARGTGKGRL
ncbi:MAG: hypothetical protein J5807_03670, partial [Kiritimatiellae bacterium]|nr:hypothetical protein [Kiritimatiellia bacterium]